MQSLLHRKLRSAAFRARVLLGQGCLPDALIIGSAKGGTTSLFEYLTQHPQVCGARFKEVRYFDQQWDRGPRWYKANFAPMAGHRLCLEATPAYLFLEEVPQRVRSLIPDARFIVLLREPVDRAYSHYNEFASQGCEPLSFREAVGMEERRHHRFAYRGFSTYGPQIERWLSHFPEERFLFLKSEDFFAKPSRSVAAVTSFLSLSPGEDMDYAPRNQRPHEVPREARLLLEGAFDRSNARVKALTGIEWP